MTNRQKAFLWSNEEVLDVSKRHFQGPVFGGSICHHFTCLIFFVLVFIIRVNHYLHMTP